VNRPLEFGGEQLAQRVEATAARAAQRRRMIAHEASVQQSQQEGLKLATGGDTMTWPRVNGQGQTMVVILEPSGRLV